MTLISAIQQVGQGAEYRTHLAEVSFSNHIAMFPLPVNSFGVTTRYSQTIAPEEFNGFLSPLKTSYTKLAGLSEMLGQLEVLMDAEDYNEDYLKPTSEAVAQTRQLLVVASGFLKVAFPLGTIYTDGDGGLRLEWIRPDRELRLVVSASSQGRSYLYHEQGDDYGADHAPSGGKFGRWLNWLDSVAKVF